MGILLNAMAAAAIAAAPGAPSERVVEAPGPSGPLQGTLLAPAGKAKAVALIVPGSGPTDRDGNNPMGLKAQPYRLLAEALARRGVATVRIDKRGMFGSGRAVPDANRVSISDYAADVNRWVASARAATGARCVWIIGHSEGGLVALAAAQNGRDICGLVLVAAAGRPIGDVIREQLRANPANASLIGQALPAIASLEAGKKVDTSAMDPALLPLFAPQVQDYLISLMSYDPSRLIAAVRRPVLIVQGERDLQVTPADARRLAAADKRAKLVLLPGVNHVLKAVSSDSRDANFATYADPSLPLAPGVAETIAPFLTGADGG